MSLTYLKGKEGESDRKRLRRHYHSFKNALTRLMGKSSNENFPVFHIPPEWTQVPSHLFTSLAGMHGFSANTVLETEGQ